MDLMFASFWAAMGNVVIGILHGLRVKDATHAIRWRINDRISVVKQALAKHAQLMK